MSKPFFICGLPRSKTAWMSVVASGQQSLCLHEPTANVESFEELTALWADDRFEYIGVSDSSLVMQMGRILSEIGPRTVIIDRDIEEVVHSINCYIAPAGYEWDSRAHCFAAQAELEKYRGHPLVSWVDYDDLKDIDFVEAVLKWLMPTATFPKLAELIHMNIQVDRDWIFERVQGMVHNNWHLDTSWQRGDRA
jgi:hypothetical protein